MAYPKETAACELKMMIPVQTRKFRMLSFRLDIQKTMHMNMNGKKKNMGTSIITFDK